MSALRAVSCAAEPRRDGTVLRLGAVSLFTYHAFYPRAGAGRWARMSGRHEVTADELVDVIIGRVRYGLTGDQMRAMVECDEALLREELRAIIRNRDEQHEKTHAQFALICDMDTQRDQLRAEIANLRSTIATLRGESARGEAEGTHDPLFTAFMAGWFFGYSGDSLDEDGAVAHEAARQYARSSVEATHAP